MSDESTENKTERVQLLMTPTEVEAIDDWGFKNRIRTRAEAIRRLCQIGLLADNTMPKIISRIIETSSMLQEARNQSFHAGDITADEIMAETDPYKILLLRLISTDARTMYETLSFAVQAIPLSRAFGDTGDAIAAHGILKEYVSGLDAEKDGPKKLAKLMKALAEGAGSVKAQKSPALPEESGGE